MPAEAPLRRGKARGPRSRAWCFTLNNYSEDEIASLIDCCRLHEVKGYVFQEELGGAEWTPHLQGVVHNKTQVALATLKSWNPRVHWEASRSIYNSVKYCSDPEKRAPGGRVWCQGFTLADQDPPSHVVKEQQLYAWQTELLLELRAEPHPRQIIWYFDAQGGSGKTAFSKFAMTTLPGTMFFSGGKFADISHLVIRSKFDPRTVIMNLPRSCEGKISYGAIEAIKDGIIQSGKYEGGCRIFAPPHVIIMANFMPDLAQLSLDRWEIRDLHMGIIVTGN